MASGLLAGVVIRFVVAVFESAGTAPALVLPLIGVFLVVHLFKPAFAVLAVLAAGSASPSPSGLPALSRSAWSFPS